MTLDTNAARDALLIQFTQDATEMGLNPPLDPRMVGLDLQGHIIGIDKVLGVEQPACFGFLAKEADGSFLALIRGTANKLEWAEDAEFIQVSYPLGGKVEAGFFGLYQRMTYVPLAGTPKPLPIGLSAAIGHASIRVVGHSLGAALATFLTLDLAMAFGNRVSACFLASPRVGDNLFVSTFHGVVKNYTAYAFSLDFVPHVPPGLNYSPLPNCIFFDPDDAGARIKRDFWCFHHSLDYAAMLDYSIADWSKLNCANAACILGPNV